MPLKAKYAAVTIEVIHVNILIFKIIVVSISLHQRS
ncbi:hypothetical protein MCEGE14_01831 [Burkholderiaceae bacterium]